MKLRQLAIAAPELGPVRQQLFELFGITEDFADPGVGEFGLENSVMALGETYFEIVAPTQDNTAAGRTITRFGNQACGYMVLMQVPSFSAFDAHLQTQRVRKVWEIDRPEVSACHLHPKDVGGAIVSFDEMRPADEWVWAGPHWRTQKASQALAIRGCERRAADPHALIARWSRVLDLSPTPENPLQLRFSDGSFIKFAQLEANDPIEGMYSITISCRDPERMSVKARELGLISAQGQISVGCCVLEFV